MNDGKTGNRNAVTGTPAEEAIRMNMQLSLFTVGKVYEVEP